MARAKYTLRVGGLTFTGRTKAEAEAERDAWIAATVAGWAPPAVFVAAGLRFVVFPDLGGGWSYRTEAVDASSGSYGTTQFGAGVASRDAAVLHARRHAAQLTYDPAIDNVDAAVVVLFLGDHEGRTDLLSWCAWQRRHRAWTRAGLSDGAARAMADRRQDPCPHEGPAAYLCGCPTVQP